jgi:hypothetical protein
MSGKMMDAIKVLGGFLSQRAGRSGGAGAILGQVLNGIAAANAPPVDPRFGPQPQSPMESLVRDSIVRHQNAGGHVPPPAASWMQQNGYYRVPIQPGQAPVQPGQVYQGPAYPGQPAPGYPGYPQPPVVRGAPVPRHDDHDHHHSGTAYDRRGEILLQAMIMAAQADGKIDTNEQAKIMAQLQPLTQSEVDYLNREFGRRHDIHDFALSVPQGMEYEVYHISLMAMNLDNAREAEYLRNLANCLRITPQACNQIHHQCGARPIY